MKNIAQLIEENSSLFSNIHLADPQQSADLNSVKEIISKFNESTLLLSDLMMVSIPGSIICTQNKAITLDEIEALSESFRITISSIATIEEIMKHLLIDDVVVSRILRNLDLLYENFKLIFDLLEACKMACEFKTMKIMEN